MIKRVDNIEDAKKCDEFLTKLIHDEKQYDDSIDDSFIVNNFYPTIYNNDDRVIFGYYLDDLLIGYIYVYENPFWISTFLYLEIVLKNKGKV